MTSEITAVETLEETEPAFQIELRLAGLGDRLKNFLRSAGESTIGELAFHLGDEEPWIRAAACLQPLVVIRDVDGVTCFSYKPTSWDYYLVDFENPPEWLHLRSGSHAILPLN